MKLGPGSYVELEDIMTNQRKLAVVDESGIGYYDLIGDDELPKPLHVELKPAPLGSVPSWLQDMEEERAQALGRVWLQLSESGLDALTVARAVRWGVLNDNTDLELVRKAGQTQTDLIVAGRKRLAERL
ncbi:hypothetical protein [Cupriavidus sp. TMH.W2]|uniref:hypothetical protein n=1 Tax=Cupriavidus sp. TMH.W2 TaxID=3434465 RepID=UPI003D7834E3